MSNSNLATMTHTFALANSLLKEHGLAEQGWKFDFNSRARSVGVCHHRTKTIELSMNYLSNPDELRDTILHEIAHALVGPGKGHGYEWRAMCRKIGARPERTCGGRIATTKQFNFEVRCNRCNKVIARRYRVKQSLLNNYESKCCGAALIAYDIRPN